jgi:hypothetical protein
MAASPDVRYALLACRFNTNQVGAEFKPINFLVLQRAFIVAPYSEVNDKLKKHIGQMKTATNPPEGLVAGLKTCLECYLISARRQLIA